MKTNEEIRDLVWKACNKYFPWEKVEFHRTHFPNPVHNFRFQGLFLNAAFLAELEEIFETKNITVRLESEYHPGGYETCSRTVEYTNYEVATDD